MPLILIAEDHLDSREALKTLLEAFGYRVLEAVDGRQAIEVAADSRPDLILMDVMMPELDGFAATRELRQRDETQNVPIIAVTAMEGAHRLALAAGADDFVPKPVNTRRLLEKIASLTGMVGADQAQPSDGGNGSYSGC
ncbi:MAG: response regulator [Longimicrobiales bacterium]